jgi:hypothetical protein
MPAVVLAWTAAASRWKPLAQVLVQAWVAKPPAPEAAQQEQEPEEAEPLSFASASRLA